jgi:putative endonuclease
MSDTPQDLSALVKTNRTSVGKFGEELARGYFTKNKFNIVDHNFRCPLGEIDLIVRKSKALRFVEVKYRRSRDFGLPQDSVVRRKQRRIRNAAVIWLKRRHLPMDSEIHFDVLAITELRNKRRIEYIQDAF